MRVAGVLIAIYGLLRDAPGAGANEPTPLLGVWERIDIGVFLAWLVVLALAPLRRGHARETHAPARIGAHVALENQ